MFPELNIKKLGFGLMRLPMLNGQIDIEQVKQMADLFLAKGFTYFDTAWGYHDGKSEEVVKTVLVDRHPRENFLLATKLPAWAGPTTAEEAKNMFWTSLKRSGAGYFDFYLLHNLGPTRTGVFDKFGIWDFLAEQKKEGRIRHLGFSMHATGDYLEKILEEHPEMEFVQTQVNYSDWESGIVQSRRCCEVARKFGKPIIVMEPVKGGALANLPQAAADILKAANPNASQASWAIRFAASQPGVLTVLSGMSTLTQMEDNLSFMEPFTPLTDAESAAIEKVRAILAATPQIPCTDCKYCVKDCPQRISIPDVIKIMNDYNLYRRMDSAKGSYGFATRANGKASSCIACGNCETVCPQSIGIIEELKKAAETLEK
jgi:predicted aldo/keto reductase-like oxidoreductase